MTDRGAQFKSRGRAAGRMLARLLFPPVCAACRRIVAEPGTLCGACWPRLRFLEEPLCQVLGTPFAHQLGEAMISPAAIANPPPFERARAAVVYHDVARQMVQGLKFRDRTDLAPWMARWMMRAGSALIADADAVVPVPLHRRRFLMRRFNQSAELARTICLLSGKPFFPELVTRVRATRQQVGLRAREREENVRGAFTVPHPARDTVRGRRVLLIDDVYTTGMTVSAIARVLKRRGAASVDVLTFARVLPGDFQPDEVDTIWKAADT